ncbi:hypothetical protein FGO68_gene5208 [Halteria grandinella]|uniref:Uncharacterized protein n=1 Tax=Halteria grandinella TaxID=5974 RepID=A0A8J8NEC9_HALGN|nr:hypothetical protein FGO68_gene5208 [Halteria grandinella]
MTLALQKRGLQTELKKQKENADQIRRQFAKSEAAQKDQYEKQLKVQEEAIKQLEKTIKTLNKEFLRYQEDNKAKDAELAKQKVENARFIAENTQQQADNDQLKQDNTNLKIDNTSLKSEVTQLNEKNINQEVQITLLKKQLDESARLYQLERESMQVAASDLNTLKLKLQAEYKIELEKLMSAQDQKNLMIKELQDQIQTLTSNNKEYKLYVAQMKKSEQQFFQSIMIEQEMKRQINIYINEVQKEQRKQDSEEQIRLILQIRQLEKKLDEFHKDYQELLHQFETSQQKLKVETDENQRLRIELENAQQGFLTRAIRSCFSQSTVNRRDEQIL